jgi:tRNA-2-methylthio-N6-dimethylallyladenosine synthase
MKIFLKTYGCQMNVRDSEVICGLLRTMNYELITTPEQADVIIFNTCSVRQHAEEKVWSELGKFRVHSSEFIAKKQRTMNHEPRTKPIIGLIGCMAQNYKEKIFQRAPNVDFVVGPSDIHKIPSIIAMFINPEQRTLNTELLKRKIWETAGDIRPEEIYHTGFYADKNHAYVVISEGCSNFCSYCVVPYVRGPLHNRNHLDILKEIERAVKQGITRITLLGQNVNAYQFIVNDSESRVNFIELLKKVNAIKGLKEFSFVTSHPKDASIELFKAMSNLNKLKKHLHLPVQSGSDKILKLMNRGYGRKNYLDLIDKYRKIIEGSVLTTDIIVGFPGESQEDFRDTYDLVKEAQFDAAYIFKYSPRPNTQAEKSDDDVPRKEKERRHALILELQRKISKGKNVKSKI